MKNILIYSESLSVIYERTHKYLGPDKKKYSLWYFYYSGLYNQKTDYVNYFGEINLL